jgi:hypothetical protein
VIFRAQSSRMTKAKKNTCAPEAEVLCASNDIRIVSKVEM